MSRDVEWLPSREPDGVSYPAAPWRMAGSLWLTLFRMSGPAGGERPAGLYGAAFVSYEEPSPLTYRELLVARPAGGLWGRGVTVTDIWVDSAASLAGGRELWAIPKGLGAFERATSGRGAVATTVWSAEVGDVPVASAWFHDVPRVAPRLPFGARLHQPGLADTAGQARTAAMHGTARVSPARGHWELAPDGPLGWLAGARQLGSFRLGSFRMACR